jgi:hypothetical protein
MNSIDIFDPTNPDPWTALEFDDSTFIAADAKSALIRNNRTWSRRVLLTIIRPLARISIGVVRFIRLFVPNTLTSTNVLHATLIWGMKNFVSKDANFLILRHFNIGTQILRFLNDNLAEGRLPSDPLLPRKIEDLRDNVFVRHDLNLYNFVILVQKYFVEQGKANYFIENGKVDIQYSAIQDVLIDIDSIPDKWHNFLDLQSAIELYTPLFALFLSREDFERASNSLQLDETIAVYVAKLLKESVILSMVNNGHPMVPLSTVEAGFRLMLHGLDAENLYGFIKFVREHKGG